MLYSADFPIGTSNGSDAALEKQLNPSDSTNLGVNNWTGVTPFDEHAQTLPEPSVEPPVDEATVSKAFAQDLELLIETNNSDTQLYFDEAANDLTADTDPRIELIVIDSTVHDVESIISDIKTNNDAQIEFLILQDHQDGITQITQKLKTIDDVDAIHIISHGSDGVLWLGATALSNETLEQFEEQLISWSDDITEDGDILLYGCDFAGDTEGQELVATLSQLTGADISASDDLTGHSDLGGDWQLEYTVGEVETDVALSNNLQQYWKASLVSITVNTTADILDTDADTSSIAALQNTPGADGNISLREATEAAINEGGGLHTIILPSGEYRLEGTELRINGAGSDILFDGADDGSTIIKAYPDASSATDRVLRIDKGFIEFRDVTITGGNGSAKGGGIFISKNFDTNTNAWTGGLTLTNTIVENNYSSYRYGGISAEGKLTINNSLITNNSAAGIGGGLGTANLSEVVVTDTVISNNTAGDSGGGIHMNGVSLILNNVLITGNSGSDGGGIRVDGDNVTLDNVTITDNEATSTVGLGGLSVTGGGSTVEITDSVIAGNRSDNVGATDPKDVKGPIVSDGTNYFGDDQYDTDSNSGVQPGDVVDGNSPPRLHTIETTQVTYAANPNGIIITNEVTITDSKDINLESATISISNNLVSAEDELLFNSQNGINGTYDSATGVLSLTGTASIANYETALRSVTYNNTNTNPTGPTRTISFKSNDGDATNGESNTVARIINFGNAAPILDLDGSTAGIDYAANFTPGNSDFITNTDATITDDNSIQRITIQIQNVQDGTAEKLVYTDIPGTNITGTYDQNSHTLTLENDGTANFSNFEQALTNVKYENTAGTGTGRDITFIATDEDGRDSDPPWPKTTLTFPAVDEVPEVDLNGATAGTGNSVTYTENDNPLPIAPNASVNTFAEDDIAAINIVTTGFQNSSGSELHIFNTTIVSGTASSGTVLAAAGIDYTYDGAETIIFTDTNGTSTKTDTESIIQSFLYYNSSNFPVAGDIDFAISVEDANGQESVAQTSTVSVVSVNAIPVLDADADDSSGASNNNFNTTFTIGGSAVSIVDSDATITDDSQNLNFINIQIIDQEADASETLTYDLSGTSVTALNNAGNHTLTLKDGANIAEFQQVLRTVEYSNTNSNPAGTQRTINFTTEDSEGGNTGWANAQTFISFLTPATNETPSVDLNGAATGTGTSTTYTANDSAVAITPNATINDYAEDDLASINISTSGFLSRPGSVLEVASASIDSNSASSGTFNISPTTVVAYDYDGTSKIVFTNNNGSTLPLTDAETLLQSLSYVNTNTTPTTGDINFQITVEDTAAQESAIATATVTVVGANNVPELDLDDTSAGNNNSTSYIENDPAVSVAPNATIEEFGEDDIQLIELISSGFLNEPDSVIHLGSANIASGSNATGTVTVGSTSIDYEYLGTDTIEFTNNSTGAIPKADAELLIRSIQYENTSENFAPVDIDLSITLEDTNLQRSSAVVATVTLVPQNDAPVIASTAINLRLDSVAEDSSNNPGHTVAYLLATANSNTITDVDGDPEGIAIYAANDSNGTWQYSLNGGNNWSPIAPASYSGARLLDTSAHVRYVPNADFDGASSFDFRAWDQTTGTIGGTGNVNTSGGTTSFSTQDLRADIDITPVNDAPVTTAAAAISTNEDTPKAITLKGSDIDGNVASFEITSLPANGDLFTDAARQNAVSASTPYSASSNEITLYFAPTADWNGTTSFDFTTIDDQGLKDTTPETLNITVNSVNDAPEAIASSFTTNQNTGVDITLSGTDIDGTIRSFIVDSPLPANGTLYTDSSRIITVNANETMTVYASSHTIHFVPDNDWSGTTSFDYFVVDNDSEPSYNKTVTISVAPEPTTAPSSTTTDEDTAVAVTLTGSAVGSTVTEFEVGTLPNNGTLYTDAALTTPVVAATNYAASAEELTLYFAPDANWNGNASFEFSAINDVNLKDATPETAVIVVDPVNDQPIVTAPNATTNEDTAVAITLSGTDIDGFVDTFRVDQLPENGTLYTDPALTSLVYDIVNYPATAEEITFYFKPDQNWYGTTYIGYVGKDDNGLLSAPKVAYIDVDAVNDEPTTVDANTTTNEDTSVAITLDGSDVDGTVDAFNINSLPNNGTLYTDSALTIPVNTGTYSASSEQLIVYFAPTQDWDGTTSFIFNAVDNQNVADASNATATITVNAVNDNPTAHTALDTSDEDIGSSITLTGSDIDGTVDSFEIQSLPSNVTLYTDAAKTNPVSVFNSYTANAEALTLYYMPDSDWNGTTTFDYQAIDNQSLRSSTETATIEVSAVNDEPSTTPSNSTTAEDTALTITLAGSDIDGTVESFDISSLPSNGTLFTDPALTTPVATGNYAASAEKLTLHFLPATNWNGTTSFGFNAVDDKALADSTIETAIITVAEDNDNPVSQNAFGTSNEDTAAAITLSATDTDGTVDAFEILTLPTNISLYTDSARTNPVSIQTSYTATAEQLTLYYSPSIDWNGSTSFDFQAIDDLNFRSNVATASIDILAVNDEPITAPSNSTTDEDTAIAVTLTGTDIETTVSAFELIDLPANGTLYTDASMNNLASTQTVYSATAEALNLFFVPNTNWSGTTTFNFVAIDTQNLADSTHEAVTITVDSVNDIPVATPLSTTVLEDTPAQLTLSGADIDGTVSAFKFQTLPSNSTLYTDASLTTLVDTSTHYATTNEQLTVYFKPNENWAGNTSFDFNVIDNQNLTSIIQTADIDVMPVNDAPITTSSLYTIDEDTSKQITLTGVDIDGTVDRFMIDTLPSNGTLYTDATLATPVTANTTYAASNEQLTLHFVPDADWNGSTAFIFAAIDESSAIDSTSATASITVTAINDEPITSGSISTTNEDTVVSLTLSGSDIDGTVNAIKFGASPANGTLYLDAGLNTPIQAFSTHAVSAEQLTVYFAPEANWSGTTWFNFCVFDNDNLADTTPETALITVNSINDAPTSDAITVQTTEDTSVAITLTGDDIDSTASAFQINSLPSNGTLYTDSSLNTTITAASAYPATGEELTIYFTPNSNWNGTTSFEYAAVDDQNSIDTVANTATVIVTPENDAPVTSSPVISTTEDTAVAIILSGTDSDGTIAAIKIAELPQNGTLYLDANLSDPVQAFTVYNSTSEQLTVFFKPDSNWNGTTWFNFCAIDNLGLADSTPETAIITVGSVNDSPTTTPVSVSTPEETTVAITLSGSDIDGTVNEFEIESLPANGILYTDTTLTTPVSAAASYLATADQLTLYFTPNPNWNGSTSFDFRAIDNENSLSVSASTANIQVAGINDSPTVNDTTTNTNEDTSVAISLSGSDTDGSVVSFELDTLPNNGTLYSDSGLNNPVTINTRYTAIGEELQVYFKPNDNWSGATAFEYKAVDDTGTVSNNTATASITVDPINDEPTSIAQPVSGDEDTTIAVTLSGTDIDGIVNQFEITTLPSNGTLYTDAALSTPLNVATPYAANAQELVVYFVPESNWDGQTSLEFRAIDDLGLIDSSPDVANINVNAINDAPVSLPITETTTEDTAVALTLSGSDTDGAVEAFIISALPANGTLYTDAALSEPVEDFTLYAANSEQLSLYFAPNAEWNGTTSFDFSAVDNQGLSEASNETATIVVSDVNDPPVATQNTYMGLEDSVVPILLEGTDIDGTVDSIEITSLPANGTLYTQASLLSPVSINSSYPTITEQLTLYFAPDANWNGTTAFNYRIADNSNATDIASAPIVINAINDAPELINNGITVDEGSTSVLDNNVLSAIDLDNTPESLNYTINTLPQNGVLFIDGVELTTGDQITLAQIEANKLTYTHNGSETIQDSFGFTLTDADPNQSTIADFTITINEVIDPEPVLANETLSVQIGETVNSIEDGRLSSGANALAEELLSNNPNYAIEIVSQPLFGTVTLNADGTFIYVHEGSDEQQDSFSYSVTNEDGVSSRATVAIIVEPPISLAVEQSQITDFQLPVEKIVEEVKTEILVATNEAEERSSFSTELEPTTITPKPSSTNNTENSNNLAIVEGIDIFGDNNQQNTAFYKRAEIEVKQHNRLSNVIVLKQEIETASSTLLIITEVKTSSDSYRDALTETNLYRGLDKFGQELEEAYERQQLTTLEELTFGVTLSTTAGVLAWALRGGALLASVLTSTPLWATADPFRMLRGTKGKEVLSEEDGDVEEMFE